MSRKLLNSSISSLFCGMLRNSVFGFLNFAKEEFLICCCLAESRKYNGTTRLELFFIKSFDETRGLFSNEFSASLRLLYLWLSLIGKGRYFILKKLSHVGPLVYFKKLFIGYKGSEIYFRCHSVKRRNRFGSYYRIPIWGIR